MLSHRPTRAANFKWDWWSMNHFLRYAVVGACGSLFFLASIGVAQTTFGSIAGTVTDPSDAVLPGATVTVTNEGTGSVRKVRTGAAGVFNVPDLGVGSYEINVAATGFAT